MKILIPFASVALFLVSCKPAKTEVTRTDSAKSYTLDTCLVSGEMLGGMGKP